MITAHTVYLETYVWQHNESLCSRFSAFTTSFPIHEEINVVHMLDGSGGRYWLWCLAVKLSIACCCRRRRRRQFQKRTHPIHLPSGANLCSSDKSREICIWVAQYACLCTVHYCRASALAAGDGWCQCWSIKKTAEQKKERTTMKCFGRRRRRRAKRQLNWCERGNGCAREHRREWSYTAASTKTCNVRP